jgi:type VI secretion system protein ImpB
MPIQDQVMKSRITLIYNTVINGEPQPKELPFKFMVAGDFSDGTSKDRKERLADRKPRSIEGGNLRNLIKDMNISLNFRVMNKINPSEEEEIEVSFPIEGIHAFSPKEVAQNIPKVKQLLELKKLLQEGLTALSNTPSLVDAFKALYKDPDARTALKEQLEPLAFLALPNHSEPKQEITVEPKTEGV